MVARVRPQGCPCVSRSVSAAGCPQPSGAAEAEAGWRRRWTHPMSELWEALQRGGAARPEQTLSHQVLRL